MPISLPSDYDYDDIITSSENPTYHHLELRSNGISKWKKGTTKMYNNMKTNFNNNEKVRDVNDMNDVKGRGPNNNNKPRSLILCLNNR